jgi:hypothetical protein
VCKVVQSGGGRRGRRLKFAVVAKSGRFWGCPRRALVVIFGLAKEGGGGTKSFDVSKPICLSPLAY